MEKKRVGLRFFIKTLIIIFLMVGGFLFIIYKIFGLTYLTWLYKIIGPQEYKVEFKLNGADWISDEKLTCLTDKTMTCRVKAPEIMKEGALIIGWSYESDSKTASFIPGDEIILETKNTTFYAITDKRIETLKSIKIEKLVVDFEKGLSNDKSISGRIKTLEDLYTRWPFMFKYYEKLTILTDDTFAKYNDIHYNGTNHWGKNYIDIKGSNSDYTIIHELAHALDFNCTKGLNRITYKMTNIGKHKYDTDYDYDSTKMISESEEYDFIKLYQKYENTHPNKRPLKDYSYTDIYEFFADSLAYYYDYKYQKQYSGLVNKEIIDAVEKLIGDINSGKICSDKVNQTVMSIMEKK